MQKEEQRIGEDRAIKEKNGRQARHRK